MHHTDPEASSVAALVEYLMDDERTEVTRGEVAAVAHNLPFDDNGKPLNLNVVINMVLGYAAECGYKLVLAGIVRKPEVRGYNAWDNNRWANSGTAGGGGGDCLIGFAGREG